MTMRIITGMTRYVAIINTPGYMPDADEPATFDTAAEAWSYLASERAHDEDNSPGIPGDENDPDGPCHYSTTMLELETAAGRTATDGTNIATTGTIYGSTPGYDGDHDLGVAYSVEYDEEDDPEA